MQLQSDHATRFPKTTMHPAFNDALIREALDGMSDAELNALPFGVIRLDAEERVQVFSKTEIGQSNWKDRPVLGLGFFIEIAPCMGGPEMRGRIARARQCGDVDIEMDWTGDFDNPAREVRIRVLSIPDGGWWLLIKRP